MIDAIEATRLEVESARRKFPRRFASPHEGYAVILEELDELWEHVRGDGDPMDMRDEAVQVAAMAVRFVQDLCEDPQWRQ